MANGKAFLSERVITDPTDAREIPLEDRTFPSILALQSKLNEKDFVRSDQGSISYQEAPDIAGLVAGQLASHGIRKGDRVAVLLPNCREMLELFFGTGWLGAIFVPINTAFRGRQLKHLLELADPAAIVVHSSLTGILSGIDLNLENLDQIWIVGENVETKHPKILGMSPVSWSRGTVKLAKQQVYPDDPLAILYTSGTTGPSKGVVCPHAQFYWWGVLTGEALGLTQDDVAYTVLPMFHTNALNTLWQVLLCGGTYSFGLRFSASGFMSELSKSQATVTYLLGSMVYILLKQSDSEHDTRHNVTRALSPATSKKLVSEFGERYGIKLSEGYGSTETNLIFSNSFLSYEPGAMGHLLPEFEIKIVDELDRDVPDGESGELIIRHKEPFSISSGYFKDTEATLLSWRNLWFHTGDLVRRDQFGVYHFLDRISDSIRRRGENISSWEVEQALMSHAAVTNAAVIGVPSELGEQEVMAFVVLRNEGELTPSQLIDYLQSEIAYFSIPRYVEFVTELPETENGKVQKFALKQRGVGNNTWIREGK